MNQELDHECTSWLVFHDLTGNNTNLLHKNRDAFSRPIRNIAALVSPKDSPLHWVGLGNTEPGMTEGKVCMGVNEKGLGAVMNSGEKCTDNGTNPNAKGTPAILQEILSNSSTAKEALEMLRHFMDANDYYHEQKGSIFFFMDRDEAYIAEMTAHFLSPMRYDNGYAFRANIWHNPGMAAYADNSVTSFLNSCNREYMVVTSLNQAIRSHGKITVEDSIALSRRFEIDGSPIDRTVLSKYTISSATLEIDREFPALLSTAHSLIGPPRHTICVPFPVIMQEVHPAMLSQAWTQAAWKRFDALGALAEIPSEWLAFEQETLTRFREAQDEARKLMRSDKRSEAETHLQNTTLQIWDEAAQLVARAQ